MSNNDVRQRAADSCDAPQFTFGAAAAKATRFAPVHLQQQQQPQVTVECAIAGAAATPALLGMDVVLPVATTWASDVAMDSDVRSEDAGCASASCAGAAARAAIMGSYAGAACVASATDTVQCF